MKTIICVLLLLRFNSFAQTQEQKDSLVNEICKTIHLTKKLPDSIRFGKAFKKHWIPFIEKYPSDKKDEVWQSVYFRLQRNCPEFKEILDRMIPPKGGWKEINKKQKTKLKKAACDQLLEQKQLYYIEQSGDTVNFEIKNGFWIDHFKDSTFSKLNFKWIKDCEFEVEFIESNNASRKNFSKPKDTYRYVIVDQKENYYEVTVQTVGMDRIMGFRIFYYQ